MRIGVVKPAEVAGEAVALPVIGVILDRDRHPALVGRHTLGHDGEKAKAKISTAEFLQAFAQLSWRYASIVEGEPIVRGPR